MTRELRALSVKKQSFTLALKKIEDIDDYYTLLGVTPSSTSSEIKKAFRRVALKNHPDKHGGCPQKAELFKKLNTAQEVLQDSRETQLYTATMHDKCNATNWHLILPNEKKNAIRQAAYGMILYELRRALEAEEAIAQKAYKAKETEIEELKKNPQKAETATSKFQSAAEQGQQRPVLFGKKHSTLLMGQKRMRASVNSASATPNEDESAKKRANRLAAKLPRNIIRIAAMPDIKAVRSAFDIPESDIRECQFNNISVRNTAIRIVKGDNNHIHAPNMRVFGNRNIIEGVMSYAKGSRSRVTGAFHVIEGDVEYNNAHFCVIINNKGAIGAKHDTIGTVVFLNRQDAIASGCVRVDRENPGCLVICPQQVLFYNVKTEQQAHMEARAATNAYTRFSILKPFLDKKFIDIRFQQIMGTLRMQAQSRRHASAKKTSGPPQYKIRPRTAPQRQSSTEEGETSSRPRAAQPTRSYRHQDKVYPSVATFT